MDSIVGYKSDDEADSDTEQKHREANPPHSSASHISGSNSKRTTMRDSHDKDRYSPDRRRKESKADSSNSDRGNAARFKTERRDDWERSRDDWERPRNDWDRSREDRDRPYDRRHDNRDKDDKRRERYQDRHYRPRDHRGRGERDRRHWRSRSSSRDRYGNPDSPGDKRDKDRRRYSSQMNPSQDKSACSSNRNSSSSLSHSQDTNYNPGKASRDMDRLSDSKDQPFSPTTSKDFSYQSSANTSAAEAEQHQKAPSESPSALPSYYNPSVINPNKYAEQVQKRKLLWGNKKSDDTASKWGNAKFAQDADGKVASKFMRLMGIKDKPKPPAEEPAATGTNCSESINKQEEMFTSMEQQYEVARQATHTMRGVGLGFGSQSRPF